MNQLLTGEVAWYVTGRFYTDGDAIRDVGYFLHLQGIEGNLFLGHPNESTALFTFSANPFTAKPVHNGDLAISLDAAGQFSLYYNPQAGASFDDPDTFAAGTEIAAFSRVSIVAGVTMTEETEPVRRNLAENVFTAALVRSRPFTFGDREYDLNDLIPNGVTQWGTAGGRYPAGSSSSAPVPFTGSAIAVGGNRR